MNASKDISDTYCWKLLDVSFHFNPCTRIEFRAFFWSIIAFPQLCSLWTVRLICIKVKNMKSHIGNKIYLPTIFQHILPSDATAITCLTFSIFIMLYPRFWSKVFCCRRHHPSTTLILHSQSNQKILTMCQ